MRLRKALKLSMLITVVLASCEATSNQENSNSNHDQDDPVPAILSVEPSLESDVIRLSDVMTVDRVVHLETRPDILIPDVDEVEVVYTSKYIIVKTLSSFLQFSMDGTYIRTLARSGGGPLDFAGIISYCVDEEDDILYFSDKRDNKIQVIDLNSGERRSPISLLEQFDELGENTGNIIRNIVVDKTDHTLWCLTASHIQSNYVTMQIQKSGQLKGGVPRPENYIPTFSENQYFNLIGDTFYLREQDSDSISLIKDGNKSPGMVMSVEDYHDMVEIKALHGNRANETIWRIAFVGRSYIVINRQAIYRFPEGAWSPVNSNQIFSGSGKNPVIIRGIDLDELGFTIESNWLPMNQSGENLVFKLEAALFNEKISEITASSRQNLLKGIIPEDVEVDSNPILLIGKVK